MASTNGNGMVTTSGAGPLAKPPEQVKTPRRRVYLAAEYADDPHAAGGAPLRALPPYVDARTRQWGPGIYDDLLNDETVYSGYQTLADAVFADGLNLRPAVDDKDDQLYEPAKGVLADVERVLEDMDTPLEQVGRSMLVAALCSGNKVAELVYRKEDSPDPNGGRWALDRVKPKSRRSVSFVVDRFNNLQGYLARNTALGTGYFAGPLDPAKLPDGYLPAEKFLALTYDPQDGSPLGRPVSSCIYDPWHQKLQVLREWLIHLGRFGSPSILATTAPESDASPVADEAGNVTSATATKPEQDLLNALLRWRNGGVLVLPYGANAQFLQTANAGDSFLKRIDYADRQITKGILRSVRMTMESRFGSRADSQTSQDVTGLFTRFLKSWLGAALSRGLVRPLVAYNRGEEAARRLAPYLSLSPVEHQDWGAELVAATTAYRGGVIREDQLPSVWERMGIPPSTLPAPPPPQPPPQPGTPPAPGNGPGTPPGGQAESRRQKAEGSKGQTAPAPAQQKAAAAFSWDDAKHPRDEIGRFAATAGQEARRHYEQALDKPKGERRAFLKERLATVYKALKRSIGAYVGKRFELALDRLAEQTGLPRATFEPLRAGLPDLADLLASRYKENLNDVRSGKRSGYYGSKEPEDVTAHFRGKFGPPEAHRGDLIDSFGSAAEKIVDDFRDAEADRLGVPDADKDYEGYEKGMGPVEARAAQLHQAIASVLAFTFDPHRPGEKYETVSFAWDESLHPRGQPENKGEFAPAAGGGAAGTEKAEPPPIPERPVSDRVARARAAHKVADAPKQRYAEEHNEPRFAALVGGEGLPDSEPADVAVRRGKRLKKAVELKTMLDNTHDKLTMDSYAQVRKIELEQQQGCTFHTVVSDDRHVFNALGAGKHDESKRVYYYRRGVAGSARVGTMHRCKNEAQLLRLMSLPEGRLPRGARRTDGKLRVGTWEFFEDTQGKGYKNSETGKVVRAKAKKKK